MKLYGISIIELHDNGAWSWFMDERVVVHDGKLLVRSIRSTSLTYRDGMTLPHWGNCELAVHDLATGKTQNDQTRSHWCGCAANTSIIKGRGTPKLWLA
jgi:hypothetical protein